MSGLITVGYFLFSLTTSLFIMLLWARIALRFFKISALHPISQMIIQFTNPLLNPLNRLCSTLKINITRYDWPSFMLIVLVELIKFFVIGLFFLKAMLPLSLIVLFSLAELIVEPCNLLFYAIMIRVIMSWVNPGWQHPIASLIYTLTEPLLRFIRQKLPETAGMDFSPLIAIIALKIITIFISASLPLQLV